MTLATIADTIYAYRVIPKGFFSSEDTGVIVSRTQGLQGISFPDMVERQTLATQIISADPTVLVVNSIVAPLCATMRAIMNENDRSATRPAQQFLPTETGFTIDEV